MWCYPLNFSKISGVMRNPLKIVVFEQSQFLNQHLVFTCCLPFCKRRLHPHILFLLLHIQSCFLKSPCINYHQHKLPSALITISINYHQHFFRLIHTVTTIVTSLSLYLEAPLLYLVLFTCSMCTLILSVWIIFLPRCKNNLFLRVLSLFDIMI